MASPQDKNKPKYMCLKGKTQFEMAEAIDEALAQAERAFPEDDEQIALQIWYEQFEQQVIDEVNISQEQIPKGSVTSQISFTKLSLEIWAVGYEQAKLNDTGRPAYKLMESLFKRSFSHTMDMLKARNLWRSDLQRALNDIQGRVIHDWQQRHPGL